jgi:hypothetical protein
MRRILMTLMVLLIFGAIAGYASGLFTGEVRREDSCLLCRAVRYSGKQYGFRYRRIEDTIMTDWYRKHIDPKHGQPGHPHRWRQSACTVAVEPMTGNVDFNCDWVPPIFLLSPEIQRAVLEQIPDQQTQVALIHALDSPSRKQNVRRVRLLIQYYYIDRHEMSWANWWKMHAAEFGLSSS